MPPRVSLSRRSPLLKVASLPHEVVLDLSDNGLRSIQGAHTVIARISSLTRLNKLILTYNALGDDGCEVLFNYLQSDAGRTKKIEEIRLARNGIGYSGLLVISNYLTGNGNLRELWLQSNIGKRDSEAPPSEHSELFASSLSRAINNSHLRLLRLDGNSLTDNFMIPFLANLTAPSLEILGLTMVDMTAASIPILVSYLSSQRCRLRALSINANDLGHECKEVIDAVSLNNFGLTKLDWFAYEVHDVNLRKEYLKTLSFALARNAYLQKTVRKEALELLTCARIVLLRQASGNGADVSDVHATIRHLLPLELYHHILSFIAPTLSSTQQHHIFTYASTPETLPLLLPRLTSSGSESCVADPTRLDAVSSSTTTKFSTIRCTSGCIGGIVCQKDQEKTRWLKWVGCDMYER